MFDATEIGQINCRLNFDDDAYVEYLSDSGLHDTEQNKIDYIKEYCDFDVELFDCDTYHHCGFTTLSFDELESNFNKKMVDDIINDCLDGKEHEYELDEYTDDVDVNNPNELNKEAIKVLRHGDYYKNCRGFILTNGVVVYTPMEHNNCSKISGIKGTFDFIHKGNIRVSDHGIDIATPPTPQQTEVLYQVCNSYNGETVHLELMDAENGYCSETYYSCDGSEVISDIENYFRYGRKPKSNIYGENKRVSKRLVEVRATKRLAAGLSEEDLQKYWSQFNSEYFDNQLNPIPIKLTATSHRQGCYHYRTNGTSWIDISTYYNHGKKTILSVLLHEMIHQWQRETNQKDKDHGLDFKRKMREINSRGNWGINTTLNISQSQVAQEYAKEANTIVSMWHNGKYWLNRITDRNPQQKVIDSYYTTRTLHNEIDNGNVAIYKTNAIEPTRWGVARSLTRFYTMSEEDFNRKIKPYIVEVIPFTIPQKSDWCYVMFFESNLKGYYEMYPCETERMAYKLMRERMKSLSEYGRYKEDTGVFYIFKADDWVIQNYQLMKNTKYQYKVQRETFDYDLAEHLIEKIDEQEFTDE